MSRPGGDLVSCLRQLYFESGGGLPYKSAEALWNVNDRLRSFVCRVRPWSHGGVELAELWWHCQIEVRDRALPDIRSCAGLSYCHWRG